MGNLSKYFSRLEFRCNCGNCNFDTVDAELLAVLGEVREHFNTPVRITSSCRCQEYNANVGGSINSQHLRGRAADIVVDSYSPACIYRFLDERYPGKLGIGKYEDFVHLDTRSGRARWGY